LAVVDGVMVAVTRLATDGLVIVEDDVVVATRGVAGDGLGTEFDSMGNVVCGA